MIAYRLHFEEANLRAIERVRNGSIGEPRLFEAVFANRVDDPDNIRLNPIEKGGGTLYDIGIYCINAARYVFRAEPEEVVATSVRGASERFADCDEDAARLAYSLDWRLHDLVIYPVRTVEGPAGRRAGGE